MLFLRSTLFNVAFYASTVAFMIASLIAFVLPARPAFVVVKAWCRSNLFLLRVIAGIDYEVRGLENIPPGGVLVASKHQSAWETFALVPFFDYPTFILKRQLNWIPLFGWYLKKFGMIPIDRSKRSRTIPDMIKHARAAVAEARQIMIFPEGTRRRPGAEPRYKIGVGRIYESCEVPCVPVALNAGLYWPRRKWLRYPGTIRVDILEPIAPGLSTEAFMETLQDRIETASNRLNAEAADDEPAPPPLAVELATSGSA